MKGVAWWAVRQSGEQGRQESDLGAICWIWRVLGRLLKVMLVMLVVLVELVVLAVVEETRRGRSEKRRQLNNMMWVLVCGFRCDLFSVAVFKSRCKVERKKQLVDKLAMLFLAAFLAFFGSRSAV